jgi:hypothetical protein
MLLKTVNMWKDISQISASSNHTNRDYEYSMHIVDALTGKILRFSEIDEEKTKDLLFSKNDKLKEGILESREMNQNIFDLNAIQPVMNYKMKQTGEYTLEIKQARVHQNAAERIVIEQVVEDTQSKHHEVIISGSLLIFVPKWSTTIQFKDGHYTRQALAASKTILLDEIEFCSRDYLSSSFLRKPEVRKTFAACEDCGLVLCRKHILVLDERYVCSEHIKSIKSTGTADKNSRFDNITSKVKSVKVSSLYNRERFSNIGSRISLIKKL